MQRGIYLALAACLVLVTSSKAAPTQPEPATEDEMDRQIGDMLQKLEKAKNLNPREKRAVNVLSGLLGGGGGGGNLLNELNKGPTYSQLLGSGGGGFNKAGLLSGFLGSSSGTAIVNRRPLVSVSLGGGAGVIDDDPEAVALRFKIEQDKENSPLDLGGPQGGLSAHLAIPLRGPFSYLFTPPTPSAEDYDEVDEDDGDSDSDDNTDEFYEDDEDVNVDVNVRANLPSDDNSETAVTNTGSYGGPYPQEAPDPKPSGGTYPQEGSYTGSYGSPYQQEVTDPKPSGNRYPGEAPDPAPPRLLTEHRRDPIASRRPRKQRGRGGRSQKNGNGGASASASADGFGGADASAGAAAGGGSDSGSILSLVTPLLGSSSAGAAGGGTDGAGASVGVSVGGGGGGGANAGDLWRETMALHYRIKSFIFRKLAQLLGSSSGSPQAG